MGVNLNHIKRQVKGLSKTLKQVNHEADQAPPSTIQEVPLTFQEKCLDVLGKTMWACTALVVIEVAAVFCFPSVYDVVYESLHKNDFAEAEVFLSNQHPKLVPLLRIAQDAKYKCKPGTLRSCYLFLSEDANQFFEELAYGGEKKIKL